MSEPRPNSALSSLTKRFSMNKSKYYTTDRLKLYRSQSRRLPRDKRMSRSSQSDAMDIDSDATDRKTMKNDEREDTHLQDDDLGEGYELVDRETLGDLTFYNHPNKPSAPGTDPRSGEHNDLRSIDVKRRETTERDSLLDEEHMSPMSQREGVEIFENRDPKAEASESPDTQLEKYQNDHVGKIDQLPSKVSNLELSTTPKPEMNEQNSGESGLRLSIADRQKYEDKIRALTKTHQEMEDQIHTLLNAQEHAVKQHSELAGRYKAVVANIEREKRDRAESELNLRSEIAHMQGNYRKEKERARGYMKTMAEMQNADAFKLDDSNISSSVKELRYNIRNWVRAQHLIPSPPPQGILSSCARAIGARERGPNYDFLQEITPYFREYTETPQDLGLLLQAHVWKRIVELVFRDDVWLSTRNPLGDDDDSPQLPAAYRAMKKRLWPEPDAPKEYVTHFHEWRSTTARILSRHPGFDRRKHTISAIVEEVLKPFVEATYESQNMKQEIQNIEDLESVIESAISLAASTAQQRANFTFEFIPSREYGRMEFKPSMMTEQSPPEPFDEKIYCRMVFLTLAPRFLKYGTSEGTGFEVCKELLEFDVETRICQRRVSTRRQIRD